MKKLVLLAFLVSVFQSQLTTLPNPYVTSAFYALQAQGKTEACELLKRIPTVTASTLTLLLHDTRVFLDSEKFLKGLSFKTEKPLFEKAIEEGLKNLKFEGVTAKQQREIDDVRKRFSATDRSTFINNLRKLGYENPEAFDRDFVSPEVRFAKSPTSGRVRYGIAEFLAEEASKSPETHHRPTKHLRAKTEQARPRTPPSPPTSESFYSSPGSHAKASAHVSPDPLPERRVSPDPLPERRDFQKPAPHARARRQERQVRQGHGGGESRRSTSRTRTASPQPAPAQIHSAAATRYKEVPRVAIDLTDDLGGMPSIHEIQRDLDPTQFYKPSRRRSLYSSQRPPSPTRDAAWHDFTVDDDFFDVPPTHTSRSSSPAILPSEVGLPSSSKSSRHASPTPRALTLRDLPPPPPRPALPLRPELKPHPAAPTAATQSRRSSSSSSSSESLRPLRPKRPTSRVKPRIIHRKPLSPPLSPASFSKLEKEARAIFRKSEEDVAKLEATLKALDRTRTRLMTGRGALPKTPTTHLPGFITDSD